MTALPDEAIRIVHARWPEDAPALRTVRHAVFVVEQHVDERLEWDGRDVHADHLLALDAEGRPIGTGRLEADGKIGRMAVLAAWRHMGVGSRLLGGLLERARHRGLGQVYLHAQEHALAFYHRHGFLSEGPRFIEADIPHFAMSRPSAESYRLELAGIATLVRTLWLLADAAREQFTLLTPRASSPAYADPYFGRALSRLARRGQGLGVRIFVLEPEPTHPLPVGLRDLVHDLPSRAGVRAPSDDRIPEGVLAQVTADVRHCLILEDDEEGRGSFRWQAPRETRRALQRFDDLWNEGETPAFFRRFTL